MNKRKLLIIIIVITIVTVGLFLFNNKDNTSNKDDRIKVVTSFYPLYFFTSQIGGDKIEVFNITPSGAEPHSYEPTAKDMALIEDGDLLILNGGGLEGWEDNLKNNILDKNKIIIVGDGIINVEKSDPHIWLSPKLAIKIVGKIEERLSYIDPTNSEYYKNNLELLEKKLFNLDLNFTEGLSNCKNKDVVTAHMAFGYLAKDYGFSQTSISGLSTEEEPSTREMIKLSNFVRNNNIKYIFYESLMSPKLSDTIAEETGALTLVLNPIAGLTNNEKISGEDYFSLMKQNLINLKIALECKQ